MGESVLCTLQVVFLCLVILPVVSSQSNGDLRLQDGTSENNGRLEIFWNGTWGTFCSINFNRGAAQAACRQLGYLDQLDFNSVNKLNYSQAENDTPVVIGAVECGYSLLKGQLHILRCNFSESVPSGCSHELDVGVKCNPVSLWLSPYKTQVRLEHSQSVYTSAGTLEVYIDEEWGNVCYSDFDQHAADSACRQMGYTNANSYLASSTNTQPTVWLDGVTCGKSTSCPCLNQCFELPSFPVDCDSLQYIHIECTFDISLRDNETAGGYATCINPGLCRLSKNSIYLLAITAAAAILSFLVIGVTIVACITVIVCCCMPTCALYKWRQKHIAGYLNPPNLASSQHHSLPQITITPPTPSSSHRETNTRTLSQPKSEDV